MATVNKNFVVKNGLVVQGSTATVNGNNILTENIADSYILNLVGGATLVKSVDSVFAVDGNGNLTLNYGTGLTKSGTNLVINRTVVDTWYDAAGSADTAENNAKSYTDNAISALSGNTSTDIANAIAEAEAYTDNSIATEVINRNNAISQAVDQTESYTDSKISQEVVNRDAAISSALTTAENYTDTAATNAINTAATYTDTEIAQEVIDRNNAINTAKDAAQDYADTVSTNAENAAKAYADSLAPNYDPAGSAAAAQTAAQNYADGAANQALNSAENYADTVAQNAENAAKSYADTVGSNTLSSANSYTDTSVANLVNNAPAMLDTLKELADAIADNPNYATDVANLVATKANTTYVDTQDSATLASANLYTDNAVSTEATDRTTAIGIAIASGDAMATPTYKALDVNAVAKAVASSVATLANSNTTVYSWDTSDFSTGKFLVKIAAGIHTQVIEVLATLDTSGNVHVTEYAEVSTNGSMGTITVAVSSGTAAVVANTTSNATVNLFGTLLRA